MAILGKMVSISIDYLNCIDYSYLAQLFWLNIILDFVGSSLIPLNFVLVGLADFEPKLKFQLGIWQLMSKMIMVFVIKKNELII
jgi:hypothetical protein